MKDFFEELQNKFPVCRMNPYAIRQLRKSLTAVKLNRGDVLFEVGEQDSESFFLLRGEIEMLARDGFLSTVRHDEKAALYPLGNLRPRQFTARVKSTAATLVHVESDLLDKLVTLSQISSSGDLEDTGYDIGIGSSTDDWLARLLSSKAMMRVPAANLESLLAKLKNQYVNKNEVVFRENDPGDCYYIVAEGRFAVSKKSPAGEMVLSELGPGDIFGEDALVANTTRSATVTALVQGHLKALSKKHFEELLKPPMLNSISWGQAFALIKKGAVPLDVRTEEEFEQDKRKWAVNLPLYLLRLKLRLGSKLLTPEKRYVVFCDTGQRSAVVAYILAQNDITSYVVEGGLGSLKLSDGP